MRRFRRTTLITSGSLAVLAGLGLARLFHLSYSSWFILFLPALILIKKKNFASLAVVIILGLGLGLWRGSLYEQNVQTLNNLSGRQITVEARAASDAIYTNNNQLQFTANKVVLLPEAKSLAGSYKIAGFGVHMVYRGDIVRVSGKIYPSRGSNQARMSFAQIDKLSDGHSWSANLSRRFSTGMQNALPEPLSSFGMGLLVGQRSNMPAQVTAELTAVGLVHIVAVSGYNLTIIVRAISRLRLSSKYQQLIASLALIGLFLSVTGFSASIVRAAIVSSLSLWAWFYGRKIKPAVLISFAAALTGFANPFYVWGDMSWYLSFLAFFGVMIIAPTIQARAFARPPKFLTIVLLETLSAEIMTLPLIMLSFNQLSLVALLANVLIVPLVPVAMLLAAIAGTAGMLAPQLTGWFAYPARLLLTYMLDIVHMLAQIPSVLVHASISFDYMVLLYAIAAFVVLVAYKKKKAPERVSS